MLKESTQVNYQSFTQINDDDDVVINVVPQSGSSLSLWRHYINDLDFFFKKIYKYHQYGGFNAILVKYITQLIQFAFVVALTFFLINGIDLNRLTDTEIRNKTLLSIFKDKKDIHIQTWQYPIFFIIILSFIWRTIKLIKKCQVYFCIRQFYSEGLRIKNCNLFTWQEIQIRLIETERVCLFQDKSLTELDVHNRLLRRKNYLIALINKQILPIYYRLPFVGETIYFPKGLLYCFQLLLFKAPGIRLFETRWKLKDEYKQFSKREECAKKFKSNCFYLSFVMIFLGFFFSFWQFLNLFYTYADEMKSKPERVFSLRTWSNYSKFYCRHFNELDHSLEDRLNKAYKPANKYMNSFISIPLESIAKLIRFMLRAILGCISILTLIADHVLQFEHTITLISVIVFLAFACESFIREDVPQRFNQAELYSHVLEHIHYFPSKHLPSTLQARSEFGLLFKHKIIIIIEELLSPLVSPYILFKHMSNRSYDVIDFFRNCTIDIPGIGDVCSFAMMNIEKNGNSSLRREFQNRNQSGSSQSNKQSNNENEIEPQSSKQIFEPKIVTRGDSYNMQVVEDIENFGDLKDKPEIPSEGGKLELSLINFQSSNPSWTPFDSQASFLSSWKKNAKNTQNQILESVTSQTKNLSLNKSILPRTPYSSFINENEVSQFNETETTEKNMTISSILTNNKLADLIRSKRKTANEDQPLLSSSLPMKTYFSSFEEEK